MKLNEKVYLGDSVYAEFDGYYIKLTTNNGMEEQPPRSRRSRTGVAVADVQTLNRKASRKI